MVLRTEPLTLSQTLALRNLEKTGDYDFWKEARARSNADIMAHPKDVEKLIQLLNDQKIHHTIMVEDVEKYVLRFVKYYHKTIIFIKMVQNNFESKPKLFFFRLFVETETPDTIKNSLGYKKLDWQDYYSYDVVS